jgi:hypothetical protein
MKGCFNRRERAVDKWRKLFEKSDERFGFRGVERVPGSRFSVIEAVWEEDSVGV